MNPSLWAIAVVSSAILGFSGLIEAKVPSASCNKDGQYIYSSTLHKEPGLRFCRRYRDNTCCKAKQAEKAVEFALPYFQETALPLSPIIKSIVNQLDAFKQGGFAVQVGLDLPLNTMQQPNFPVPETFFLEENIDGTLNYDADNTIHGVSLPVGFSFWRDIPHLCRSIAEEASCMACEPSFGTHLSQGICLSSCNVWFRACQKVLYSSAQAADETFKPCPSQVFNRRAEAIDHSGLTMVPTTTSKYQDMEIEQSIDVDGDGDLNLLQISQENPETNAKVQKLISSFELNLSTPSGAILSNIQAGKARGVHTEPMFCSALENILNSGEEFCSAQKVPMSKFEGACFEPPSVTRLITFLRTHNVSIEDVLDYDFSGDASIFLQNKTGSEISQSTIYSAARSFEKSRNVKFAELLLRLGVFSHEDILGLVENVPADHPLYTLVVTLGELQSTPHAKDEKTRKGQGSGASATGDLESLVFDSTYYDRRSSAAIDSYANLLQRKYDAHIGRSSTYHHSYDDEPSAAASQRASRTRRDRSSKKTTTDTADQTVFTYLWGWITAFYDFYHIYAAKVFHFVIMKGPFSYVTRSRLLANLDLIAGVPLLLAVLWLIFASAFAGGKFLYNVVMNQRRGSPFPSNVGNVNIPLGGSRPKLQPTGESWAMLQQSRQGLSSSDGNQGLTQRHISERILPALMKDKKDTLSLDGQ